MRRPTPPSANDLLATLPKAMPALETLCLGGLAGLRVECLGGVVGALPQLRYLQLGGLPEQLCDAAVVSAAPFAVQYCAL